MSHVAKAQTLVRLAAEELSFAPAQLQAGAHPTAVSFQWHNFGPSGHHLINGAVRADFYLSRNNVAGDGDDVLIGGITDTITFNDGFDLDYTLSAAQRNQLTIPIDASGAYYVVVCARHQPGSGYFDDNTVDPAEHNSKRPMRKITGNRGARVIRPARLSFPKMAERARSTRGLESGLALRLRQQGRRPGLTGC
jgi:hypothetical protein